MDGARLDTLDTPRDPVTGLPGVEAVREGLDAWARAGDARGRGPSIHALLLGLRRFDAINLTYGPASADAALAEVAARMTHFAGRELDGPWLLARTGGGNFVLVAETACSRERWQLFASQLADAVARPIVLSSGALRLSPRVALLRGLADEDAESILDRLGHALAAARRQQGRRLAWADGEATRPGRTAAQLEADLLVALDRDEIEIVFQPQFALPSDGLTGAEALARWNHPRLGRIGAAALFAIAERMDHVVPLSAHIARRALEAAACWRGELRLSLNVTAADLAVGSFAPTLLALVEESGFPASRLTLEVTEQVLIAEIQPAQAALTQLAEAGLRIALDDFGAGFCNFRYLKLLPLHYLKLDRSMVDGIAVDSRDLAVLRGIVAMARALDIEVIAEGVETEAQRELLGREDIAFYQGFLRAQPMGAAEFAALAARPA